MSKAWGSGSTTAHRRARAYVLQRDRYVCQLQLDGCTYKADQAHHIQGKALTGDDPNHMIAACRACNLKVGDPRKQDPAPTPRTQWT